MKLIVIGCGRVGSELAYHLFQQGHQVCVVDQYDRSFNTLPGDFRGRTLEGDAMNQIVLRRAGIETADGVVVVTNFDMTNAVIGHIAQTYYKVPSVVVGNFEPRFRYVYDAFNLQVVSPSHWGAQRIEELLYTLEARMVFSAGNGEVELYELLIPPEWDARPLQELIQVEVPESAGQDQPEGAGQGPSIAADQGPSIATGQDIQVAALTRAGRAVLPAAGALLKAGDLLLVSATFDGISTIRRRLENLHGQEV